jgi:hypothetical protein
LRGGEVGGGLVVGVAAGVVDAVAGRATGEPAPSTVL